MASNSSSDFATQIPPDPFHALLNNAKKRSFHLLRDKLLLTSNCLLYLFQHKMFPELWWSQRYDFRAQYLKSFEVKSAENIAKDKSEKEKKKLKNKNKKTLAALVKQESEINEENNDDDSDTDDGSSEDSLDEEVVQVPTNKSDEEYANLTDTSKGINPPWRITGSTQTLFSHVSVALLILLDKVSIIWVRLNYLV